MQKIKRFAPVLGIFLLACLATPWLIGPPCPKRLVIATGSKDGAYYAFAQSYRDILAQDGVTLEIRPTAGSVENGKLLANDPEVSLAIIQGGVEELADREEVESLASLYLEPVWVFYRGDEPLEYLTELRSKRIAIGKPDSGTQSLARTLLNENNIVPEENPDHAGTHFVPWGGTRAARALKAGEIDAAFFVISPQSPIVRELLQAEGVNLLSFRRADAYRHKYPFLSSVTLSEGMLDLDKNVPARDIVLLAPAANLVARRGMHDALVPLILDAAMQVHRSGGFLEQPGTFPTLRYVDGPVNAKARRYFKAGRSLFYRVLPFRLAVRLDQIKLIAIPLFTLLLPLFKAAPPIYRWSIRSKIYRWYRVLREVDVKLKEVEEDIDFAPDIARLRELDGELSEVSVPLSYMEEFYNLRLHVAYLRNKLLERQQRSGGIPLKKAA